MSDFQKIPITNFTITETHTITKITIKIANVVLYTSAEIYVTFFSENDEFVKYKIYRLEGENYAAWGNNDSYIIEWILAQENIN